VFAQGTFVDGSTLELSADGPIRAPYIVYAQGGTHWTHWQLVLEEIVQVVGHADRKQSERFTAEKEIQDVHKSRITIH
jgi:Methionine gamma-lyase